MELARLRNGERSGPFEYFQWGKYNRRKVVDIIKEDPYYIMVAVKTSFICPPVKQHISPGYTMERFP